MAESCEFVGMTLPFVGDYAAYRNCQAGGSNDEGEDSSMNIGELIKYVYVGTPEVNSYIYENSGTFTSLSINENKITEQAGSYTDNLCSKIAKGTTVSIYQPTLLEQTLKFYTITSEDYPTEGYGTIDSIEEIEINYTFEDDILTFTVPDTDSEIFGIYYQIGD